MSVASHLSKAKAFCEKQNLQFTEPRAAVLKLLLSSPQPKGAYAILEELSTKDYKPNPPTVYRAIDFWVKHGFIHKITSLNTFIACQHEHSTKQLALLVCDQCKNVDEAHIEKKINYFNSKEDWHGFSPQSITIEIHGLCQPCQSGNT